MKKGLLIAIMVLGGMSVSAQVVFTKFKFIKDSPFGAFPTRKATDAKFKVTGSKTIKTMKVLYSGVDQVNDAVCSNIVGAVNANIKHTKYKYFIVTGPFESGKTYSKWASGSFFYPTQVTAFPQEIYIDYMDKTSDTIRINRDNISTYFPKIQWIDVDYEHGFQPSN